MRKEIESTWANSFPLFPARFRRIENPLAQPAFPDKKNIASGYFQYLLRSTMRPENEGQALQYVVV